MYWHDGIILYGSNRTNIEIVLIIEKEIMESIFIFVLIFLFNNSSNLYYIKQSAYLKLTVKKKSFDY